MNKLRDLYRSVGDKNINEISQFRNLIDRFYSSFYDTGYLKFRSDSKYREYTTDGVFANGEYFSEEEEVVGVSYPCFQVLIRVPGEPSFVCYIGLDVKELKRRANSSEQTGAINITKDDLKILGISTSSLHYTIDPAYTYYLLPTDQPEHYCYQQFVYPMVYTDNSLTLTEFYNVTSSGEGALELQVTGGFCLKYKKLSDGRIQAMFYTGSKLVIFNESGVHEYNTSYNICTAVNFAMTIPTPSLAVIDHKFQKYETYGWEDAPNPKKGIILDHKFNPVDAKDLFTVSWSDATFKYFGGAFVGSDGGPVLSGYFAQTTPAYIKKVNYDKGLKYTLNIPYGLQGVKSYTSISNESISVIGNTPDLLLRSFYFGNDFYIEYKDPDMSDFSWYNSPSYENAPWGDREYSIQDGFPLIYTIDLESETVNVSISANEGLKDIIGPQDYWAGADQRVYDKNYPLRYGGYVHGPFYWSDPNTGRQYRGKNIFRLHSLWGGFVGEISSHTITRTMSINSELGSLTCTLSLPALPYFIKLGPSLLAQNPYTFSYAYFCYELFGDRISGTIEKPIFTHFIDEAWDVRCRSTIDFNLREMMSVLEFNGSETQEILVNGVPIDSASYTTQGNWVAAYNLLASLLINISKIYCDICYLYKFTKKNISINPKLPPTIVRLFGIQTTNGVSKFYLKIGSNEEEIDFKSFVLNLILSSDEIKEAIHRKFGYRITTGDIVAIAPIPPFAWEAGVPKVLFDVYRY